MKKFKNDCCQPTQEKINGSSIISPKQASGRKVQNIYRVPAMHIMNLKKLRYNRKRSLSNSQPAIINTSAQALQFSKPQTQIKVHEMEIDWEKLKPKLSRSKSHGMKNSRTSKTAIQLQQCSTTRNIISDAIQDDNDEISQIENDSDSQESPIINKIKVFENLGGTNKTPSNRIFYNTNKTDQFDDSNENVSPIEQPKAALPNSTNQGAVMRKFFPLASSLENEGFISMLKYAGRDSVGITNSKLEEMEPVGRKRSYSKWQDDILPRKFGNSTNSNQILSTKNESITDFSNNIGNFNSSRLVNSTKNENSLNSSKTLISKLSLNEKQKSKNIMPATARASNKPLEKENQSSHSNIGSSSTKNYSVLLKKQKSQNVMTPTGCASDKNLGFNKKCARDSRPYEESSKKVIKEEPENENLIDDNIELENINIDTILSADFKNLKNKLKKAYNGTDLEEALKKLQEAAMQQKAAQTQFEKIKLSLIMNCQSQTNKENSSKIMNRYSRNAQPNQQNLLVQSKTRPESCAKMRFSLNKQNSLNSRILSNKRSTSTLKGKIVVI